MYRMLTPDTQYKRKRSYTRAYTHPYLNYHISGEMYRMVPLYVLGTKIYHFVAKFFQIGQILNLESINSESDNGPHLSAVTWQ
jgi:hypothetical protein